MAETNNNNSTTSVSERLDSVVMAMAEIADGMRVLDKRQAECLRLVERIERRLGQTGSFYEVIDKVRYKRRLLDQAREAVKTGGVISRHEAEELWQEATRDGRISALERRTLGHVRDAFSLTNCADAYLAGVLGNNTDDGDDNTTE